MPVLVTAAMVTAMFSTGRFPPGNERRASFLNPRLVRERLAQLPPSEGRERAIVIAERFGWYAREYEVAAAAGLEAYASQAARWDSTAADLIAQWQARDGAFAAMIGEIVRVREELLEVLSEEEWERVFG